jgi:hypothetical protein
MRETFLGFGVLWGKERFEESIKEASGSGNKEEEEEDACFNDSAEYCDSHSKKNNGYRDSDDDSNANSNELENC